mmetsp:Transcript_7324/g.14382  ORF Transcript_7324/g.14382 Transcript_7324/m.14382 type:complete len:209 (+) Transcript_7324:161-787(+)
MTDFIFAPLVVDLEVIEVVGKGLDGGRPTTALFNPVLKLDFAVLVAPPHQCVHNEGSQHDHEEGSQCCIPFRALFEAHGNAHQQKRHDEKDEWNERKWKASPRFCRLAQLSTEVINEASHLRDGISPNEYSGHIEKQMHQRNLQAFDFGTHKRGQQSGRYRTYIRSQNKGIHLLKAQDAYPGQWSKNTGRDTAALNQNGDCAPNNHGK